MSNLLDSANSIMDELGLQRVPTILSGLTNVSADPNARKLLACAQRSGHELYMAHNWGVLHREYLFTTEADVDNYALPEDFGRKVSNAAWDRTSYRAMRGNLSPAAWQQLRSGSAAAGGTAISFRALVGSRQGSILLDPIPAGEVDLVMEYVSSYWVENTAGEPFEQFQSDFHHVRMNAELWLLGMRWRVKSAFGLPYADDRADYEIALRAARIQDYGLPTVNAGGPDYSLPYPNLPDGNFTAPE